MFNNIQNRFQTQFAPALLFCAIAGCDGVDNDASVSQKGSDASESATNVESESTGEAPVSLVEEVGSDDNLLQPEDYADYVGYLESSDVLDDDSTPHKPASGQNQLALDLDPLQDGDDGPTFPCATFYTGTYYDDSAPWTLRCPVSKVGSWHRVDLPSSHAGRVHSYNLKPNCGFYQYSKAGGKGHKHGRDLYVDQYFATHGVPDMRSVAIKCFDSEREFATVYEENNYGGNFYRIFQSVYFAASLASGLWSGTGLGSIQLNQDSYPDLAVTIGGSSGNVIAYLFRNQLRLPTLALEEIMSYVFFTGEARECANRYQCYFSDPACSPGAQSFSSDLPTCRNMHGRTYCTAYGMCVNPQTNEGVPPGPTPPH